MPLEPYQQRVTDEQKEVEPFLNALQERTNKLEAFIESDAFDSISANQKALLDAQLAAMHSSWKWLHSYNDILLSRIADFNGKVLTVAG